MELSATTSQIDALYAAQSRRIYAALVRSLGDFDLAEDAVQDAFRAALEKWPQEGIPENPIPWLISVGRFRAIDALRRRKRFDSLGPDVDRLLATETTPEPTMIGTGGDEILGLIFACCHPSLAPEAQIALTLREVCGLTTEEIARAFLAPATRSGL